jgi:quercetin dioxygenase-like cupin family protein
MEAPSLNTAAREQMHLARESTSGRAVRTILGGPGSALRHTVVALTAGTTLAEHENPGEATVLVLDGRVRLVAAQSDVVGAKGTCSSSRRVGTACRHSQMPRCC